ncbi:protein of unknown function [Candidatus Nitrospira inopinata]|uniref:Uncharacterized protein n=1 Tax=Candidatus Nitrospira inopinata TaxID=1715989 RepID=A0A0S4KQH2_9BACT|nr:protein of unknown function [Candidatus Nitrospira inopinata]
MPPAGPSSPWRLEPNVLLRPTNRWFRDRWVEIIRYLDQQGMYPILLGGKAEVALCGEIAQETGSQVTNLAGLTTIPQAGPSFAVVEQLSALIRGFSILLLWWERNV